MDTKNIAIGAMLGIVVGVALMYAINMQNISKLNNQISSLETANENLNQVLDAKQEIIDSAETAIEAVSILEADIAAKEAVIAGYEAYIESTDALLEQLNTEYYQLNVLCAYQTYKLEEALTILNGYDSDYEPGCNIGGVYGGLDFDDWWDLNGGPLDEWYRLVYG
jgi:nickel-dependent lactate racemase